MNTIVDFYQSLDTLNLILFWGIIIVIILLLIFSIILVNKNKKLKAMLIYNNHGTETTEEQEDNNDIPVNNNANNVQINNQIKEVIINENNDTIAKQTVTEEKNFVAEEHVMEYNKELFSLPNIEKVNIEKEEKIIRQEPVKEEIKIPNAPYQRNVLREMSLSQTSPIGIVKNNTQEERIINNAKELQNNLKEELSNEEIPKITKEDNNTYLKEVSQKLNEATNLNEIQRTAYELKQEEDAIISYQELMAKKDNIHIVDEEEAVISIEELINRKKQEEKLYNITKEEENNIFIDELKNFRHDL